ncbi:hypothetical protein T484DRAFT_1926539, partial [Baffinella frigidus]
MATSADICSFCGKHGVGLQRCSRCKQASYCGAECQSSGWKEHKQTCAPPPPAEKAPSLEDVCAELIAADAKNNWRGVLKVEGRMEKMMHLSNDGLSERLIQIFIRAHDLAVFTEGPDEHGPAVERLEQMLADLFGKMERYLDQGRSLNNLGQKLLGMGQRAQEAGSFFEKARGIGEQHGLLGVQCGAALGMGQVEMSIGKEKEAELLFRQALELAPLTGQARYQEAARAESIRRGQLCYEELDSLNASARLHEARGNPEEAKREVLALLALLRAKESKVHGVLFAAQ